MSGRPLAPALVLLLAQLCACDRTAPLPEHDVPPTPTPSEAEATAPEPAAPIDVPEPTPPPELEAVEVGVAGVGGPPESFGAIKPPLPLPAAGELTVHALAGFEVVAVYSQPDLTSPRLGYLRIGSRSMVTAKVDDRGAGCEGGFHGLPVGGFACASKGLIVDPEKPPYMYKTPPPPKVDAPIPYEYGVITADGTPMWWRIPDAEEVMLAGQRYRAVVEAQEAAAAAAAPTAPSKPEAPRVRPGAPTEPGTTPEPPATPESPPPPEPAPVPDGPGASVPDPPDIADAPPPVELTAEEKAEIARREAAARKRAEARKKEQAEKDRLLARKRARLPLNSQTPFMEHGFVVTLGDKIKQGGQQWWKTTRGGFVQASRTHRKETQDFHGGPVPEDARFAIGFVDVEHASASALDAKGALKWKRKLAAREMLAFREALEVGGRPYLVTADGLYVRKGDLRMAVLATRPPEVQPWERWIDVDLERQLLVAYEGDAPVYATLISSGKRGNDEESFLTPKGKFRIGGKHISSSMDGNTASDGRYSIQDVPWAMFFSGNYALHGAFWHSKFGARRSHGCVNLGPTDARWLFYWSTPFLPDGWHGVNAHDGAPGSMVVLH